MRKKSLTLFGLILALGLFSIPQKLLAADKSILPLTGEDLFYQSSDLSDEPIFFPDDALVEPLRLEIRLSSRRVHLYQGNKQIKTYPIAVGRPGWETPTGDYQVMQMIRNPTWIHPFKGTSIKGGDPENPLGKFWIGFWTDGKNWIGFHGTPTPSSVGKAVSHGCIRMYNKDVQELFSQVSIGTPVTVKP